MTVYQALESQNTYPIPVNQIEKICIDRSLSSSETYTQAIGISQAFELAIADLLIWLHDAPSIVEQAVGVNNAISIKQDMLDRANAIYKKYDDAKFSEFSFGFIGENFNG